MAAPDQAVVNPSFISKDVFQILQKKFDEEALVKDGLREIVQTLEKQDRATQAHLAKCHSTRTKDLESLLPDAQGSIDDACLTIRRLSDYASNFPYYKFNYSWTRQIQDCCFSILLYIFLQTWHTEKKAHLASIDDVGRAMAVPVNLVQRDAFHLTTEEYLHALISLVDELARLSRNTVTLGDYLLAFQISLFIKDVHAGFQMLNLKNDSLRKRSDSLKYRVKEVEDVVYDLSLRGFLPNLSAG